MSATRWKVLAVVLTGLAAACGNDSNGPGGDDNTAPVAGFSFKCTDLACTFTDLSSDPDGTVVTYAWEFGDGEHSATRNASHAFAEGGDYQVKLTVTDDGGMETSVTKAVPATEPEGPPAGNEAPTADFSVTCFSLTCTFTDESSDPDGSIESWSWAFGDGATSAAQHPGTHAYTATDLEFVTARLTVTDNSGATSTTTQQFTVAPPAHLTCNGVVCTLRLDQASTVQVELDSRECTAHSNTFVITAPALDTLFKDGCYAPEPGTPAAIFDLNNGEVYPAGTELDAEVISGSLKLETAPALHVEGAYPSWTLKFDDGEDAQAPEPDFNDLVVTITATPQ
jgi:PKD repeat protein